MDCKPAEYFLPAHESNVKNEPYKVYRARLLENIPWFSIIIVYVITTSCLDTITLERLITSEDGFAAFQICGSLLISSYFVVGIFTCYVNWGFLIDYKDQKRRSGSEQKGGLRHQLIWAFLVVFMMSVSLCCFAGVVWRWFQWASICVECSSEGYMTTILLKVNTANQTLNTATIQTYRVISDVLFGLTLLLTINATDVSRTDFQLSTSLNLTTPGLGDRLRDDHLLIHLADKTYEWGYTGSGVEAQRGYFTEGPDGISFPSLNPPLRSKTKGMWMWGSGERPVVEWVERDSGEVVLKTAEYRPSYIPCNELRMCAKWGLEELVLHPERMGALMAPLARTMVEMARHGMAHC